MGWFDEGIGGFFSNLLGSKNKARAEGYNVDQGAYEYGGRAGGADEAANRYKNAAEWGQTRRAVTADFRNADANRQNALEAREGQRSAAEMMMARAQGRVPSIARMAADRQMGQAVAAQGAAAASARGPAGLALAGRTQAGNIANAQSAISNQTQINEAQERLAAEQAAFGAYGGIRGQDYAGQGLDANQAQYQAGLEAQQRALNDQFSLGMTGFEHGTRQTQLGAQMQREAQRSANALGAQGINAGVGGQNAAMNQANAWGAINAGASVSGGFGSGPKPRAAGGPVEPGDAYIVGEQGPEIIVPEHAGTVIPADETAALLAPATMGRMDVRGQQAMMERQGAMQRDAREGYQVDRENESKLAAYRKYRATGLDLTEDEEREERRILGNKSLARMQSAKKDAPAASQSRLSRLGDAAGRVASSIDTSYRGPAGGYAPPPMVVLPAVPRAMGGPMMPNMPYMVGEQGPEMVLPGRSIAGAAPAEAPTSFAGGSGMLGGSPMGELRAHSAFATRFQRQGGASPMAYGGAREHGGPVGPKKAYLVGERGPEMVVDTSRAELGEIQRMRSPKSFKRDTPADQARTKRAYLDRAGSDADAMLAGYKRSLNEGASVAPVVDIDREPAPWLTAFMAAQQEPSVVIAAREEGGPVAAKQPVLVGERGPEMVVQRNKAAEDSAYARGVADAPKIYAGELASDMNTFPVLLATSGHGQAAVTDAAKTALGAPMLVAEQVPGLLNRGASRLNSALLRMRGNR